MTPEKADEKRAGRFPKGQSGNPAGKPKGTRNATTLALEALLDGQASALTQKAIDVALTGDIPALRLCMDRILPPRKDSPVAFDLPEMKTLNDAVPAMGALVKAVGDGDLTPAEAAELTKMVQAAPIYMSQDRFRLSAQTSHHNGELEWKPRDNVASLRVSSQNSPTNHQARTQADA